jgi:hypothetical protein
MRFMMLLKAGKNSESGAMPDDKLLDAMGKYNEEMVKAGVLLDGEGFHPSSKGARVRFSGGKRTLTDGPFTETKELIAGFWMIQVKSKEEAIEWASRCPDPKVADGGNFEIELRQVIEVSEFPRENEAVRKEVELRAQSQKLEKGS